MKHVKLFEQFLNEQDLMSFYNKKVKSPMTGREVKIKTLLDDEDVEDEPMVKKLKAMEQKIKAAQKEQTGRDDDEMYRGSGDMF